MLSLDLQKAVEDLCKTIVSGDANLNEKLSALHTIEEILVPREPVDLDDPEWSEGNF